MTMNSRASAFAGSIPEFYEHYLVPLIFEPYAVDLVRRVARRQPASVLEIGAGTGVVTRELARVLPPEVALTATDLNQPMLDQAAAKGTNRSVKWEQADAMQLPYPDGSFDVVVCQFAAMFFPDKAKAFSEARRVLCPGGCYLFNVWDRLEENEFAATVIQALERLLPDNPPGFLTRLPHGYHDPAVVMEDLFTAGFEKPIAFATVTARSNAPSPRLPAIAYCQGTPLRHEIEAAGKIRLEEATEAAAAAIAERFGSGPVDGKIQAHVFAVER